MGCCLDLLEMRLYQVVAKVKNQHRTKDFRDAVRCHTCNRPVAHVFVKKDLIGFTVRIACAQCNWEYEG